VSGRALCPFVDGVQDGALGASSLKAVGSVLVAGRVTVT
jgi:hypothetical protein